MNHMPEPEPHPHLAELDLLLIHIYSFLAIDKTDNTLHETAYQEVEPKWPGPSLHTCNAIHISSGYHSSALATADIIGRC